MSSMKRLRQLHRLDQQGIVDVWFLAFIVTICLLLGSLGFGIWAFMGKQDYKNNVQPKIDAAVSQAQEETSAKKDAEFVEKEKNPLRTYTGPSAYGSVAVSYPKTWNIYADESSRSSSPLDAYLNPNFVPGLQSGNNVALRIQVVGTSYADTVKSLDSQVKNGKVTTVPYAVAKVPTVVGLRVDGEVASKKQGAMIIVPVRDKTLKIWTEASQYVGDFNTIILPNITLVP